MKQALPTRKLPDRPDLEQLKRQAKELLEGYRTGDAAATSEVIQFYRDPDPTTFALHDAQLVLARSHGYESWAKLKAFVDGVTVKRLIAAVRANDAEHVRSILKIRPELVNTVEEEFREFTALHYAVIDRLPQMVHLLMEFGANPHLGISPHNDATSALTIATERGYDDIAAIIRNAARPAPDPAPAELRAALQSLDENRAIQLLEQYSHLRETTLANDQWTLLHAASALLLNSVATWLLDRGANPNRQSASGMTPFDVIGRMRDREDPTALSAMAELLRSRGAQLTPRAAVILGDIQFLHTLHSAGLLVEPRDDQGWLLKTAVEYDRPDVLQVLLGFGLDPDARIRVEGLDVVSFTWGMPLYACVRQRNHAMAETLLKHGADPNGQVYASGTPLSEAYGQRDDVMVALLERYGGKSNPSMAGLYRRADLARKLLAEHGDTSLPDDGFGKGTVAEQLIASAARGGDPEILRMGMDRVDWPKGDPRWHGVLLAPTGFWNHWIGPWCHQEWDRSTYLTCFKMILERCGPPTRQGRFGTTVLHAMVTTGDHLTAEERVAFAEALLDAGARLDPRDELLKSTPLGWACRWGRIELVKLYLERGADPVEADAEPWAAALAWAAKKGHREIASLLQKAASPD